MGNRPRHFGMGSAEVAESIAVQLAELKGTVNEVQKSLAGWMAHWERQDQAATAGRKVLYEKVEKLTIEVAAQTVTLGSLQGEVSEVKQEIDTRIMPTITAYNLASAHRAGMWLMSRMVWAALLALCTVIGFIVHEGVQYVVKGKLPFPHP